MSTTSHGAFSVIAKPSGARCNLSCRYCFYTSKAGLYPGISQRMDEDLLSLYIRQMLEAQPGPEVSFIWQGGEPTVLGLGYFRRIVELQEKEARTGKTIRNAIQTNGTLLDDDWCAFLKDNSFLVGVSLDGPRDLHDAFRVDRSGRGTFDAVMCGISLLKEHGVDFNILAAVHAANGDHPRDVYRFVRDEAGADWLQFIPIVERGPDGSVSDRSVGPEQFGRFLTGVFDEWVRRDVGRVFVQEFEVALGIWAGQPAGICVHAPTCGTSVALEHNGDVYSCDHFVDPQHLIGNIREAPLPDLVFSEAQRRFGLAKLTSLPDDCGRCDVAFLCQGGCPKDRFVNEEVGKPGSNYLCPGYRAFFHHTGPAMARMADLIRRGQQAAAIMDELTRDDVGLSPYAHVGRNDPCPCGSGLKFKKCHGDTTR